MKRILHNQCGAVLVTFVILLTVLLGFTALAMEVGNWYLVKAETAKAVDAAALAGAKNISNPYVNQVTLCQEFANENFTAGYLGTQNGSCAVDVTGIAQGKIKVTQSSDSIAILARLFGVNTVPVSSYAVAAKKKVEIMLVLDRSGSMSGSLSSLETAAKNFVEFYRDTQSTDKIGLITFATGVKVDQKLDINFIDNGIENKIDAITIPSSGDRDTNMEDALDQCDDATDRKGQSTTTLTDQSGISGDQRVQQYVIFFSDGQAKSFRGNYIDGSGNTVIIKFKRNGVDYDAVTTDPGDVDKDYLSNPYDGTHLINGLPTGDGLATTTTTCQTCQGKNCTHQLTTRWGVMAYYSLSGHTVGECFIGNSNTSTLGSMASNSVMSNYILATAKQMAIDHANVLKNKYIKIYSIGLGSVDQDLLQNIASGTDYYYYAPSSSDLDAIFQNIAKEIKLRLVQ